MRYERSRVSVVARPPWTGRKRRIAIVAVVVLLAISGTVAGVLISRGPHKIVIVAAIARPYLEANILIQNLGSPVPVGADATSWATRGDPLVSPSSNPHLALPERTWVTRSHTVALLRKAEGADLVATQHRFVSAIMTGRLQASTDQQVDGLVAAELGPRPQISSPGGASLVAWYSMTVHGNHATVDAAVETWLQVDTLEETPTGFRLTSIINQSEIEGKATLLRVNGIWKVATLDQAPWQEVT